MAEGSLPAKNRTAEEPRGRPAVTFKVLFVTLQSDYSISTSIKSLTTTALRATIFDFFFLIFCKSIAITDLRPKTYYITIA